MKRWWLGILGALLVLAVPSFAADAWKTTVDLDGRRMRSQETNLGNFVATAVLNTTGADVAVVQSSAFRDDVLLKAGPLTEQMLREQCTSPASPLVILALKPALIRSMLELAVSKVPDDSSNHFLQIAGMTVTFDSAKAVRNRVTAITVNGKPLDVADEKSTISVAMPRELGIGGSGYFRVFPRDVIAAATTTEFTLIEAIKREFAREKGVISPVVDGRIKNSAP